MQKVLPLLIALLLAGCAAPAKPASTINETVASSAAPVVTTDTGGAIHGVITDEEQVPLARATVALAKTDLKTETAQNGEFTINGVPAGGYTISVYALGYTNAVQRVQVTDGKATEVKLALHAIPVAKDPYYEHYHGVFFIQFDWFGVAQLAAVHSAMRTPCDVYQAIAPGASGALVEATWVKSVPAQGFSDSVILNLYTKPTNGTFVDGQTVISKSVSDRGGANATEDGIKLLSKAGVTDLQVVSGGLTQVAFQQKFETWFSVAYNGPIPENFTALPPK